MKWNASTVPVNVENRCDLSILLGKAFAMSYSIHPLAEDTQQILDMYIQSRRMVGCPPRTNKRYGSLDAYEATQGL